MISRVPLCEHVCLHVFHSEKFKTGCFSINFLRPLRRSEAAQNALIPGVLLAGSTGHPDIRSISIALDSLYGASVGTMVRKKGEIQSIGFVADFVEDGLAGEPVFRPLAKLVGELLLSPLTEDGGFCAEYFETEKQNLINTIRAALNNKQTYANRQLLERMFPDEPYGISELGEEEDLAAVDAKSLYAQYRTLLAESRVEILYFGRASAEEAAAVFREMLAALPRGEAEPLPEPKEPAVWQKKTVEQAMPIVQSKLSMGFRAARARTVEESARMACFAVMFGGSSSSKLFLHVREELSLCYYAGAAYDKYKGFLRVSSGIAQENYERAKAEILRQLEDCAAGRFTDEELDTAIRLLSSQLRANLDDPGRLDEFYLGQAILGLDGTLEDLIAAIERVDRAAAQAAGQSVSLDTVFLLRGVGE